MKPISDAAVTGFYSVLALLSFSASMFCFFGSGVGFIVLAVLSAQSGCGVPGHGMLWAFSDGDSRGVRVRRAQ